MDSATQQRERVVVGTTAALGLFVWAVVLLFHNLADGDLWAKLALGASFWQTGSFPRHDLFAFTPVLPVYVDHEAGSGVIFFLVLKWFGPAGLLLLKMVLALAALGIGILLARRFERSWAVLFLLAAPAAFCLLPGYVVVLRSHAITYVFFALTLLFLEALRDGARWALAGLVLAMMAWVNLHAGFVAGMGVVGIYALVAMVQRQREREFVLALGLCAVATLFNPHGPGYWLHVVPAVLHKRPDIIEWQPMPLWGWDAFLGFRILVMLVGAALVLGRRAQKRSFAGLCVLAVTFVLALRSRRHAPFFALASLTFVGPYLSCALRSLLAWRPFCCARERFALGVLGFYAALAFWVTLRFLPSLSLQVWAPVGQYPVREADILARCGLGGNLAVPFRWGSYASWRLHPAVKVSMDGRYEAAYPESTYEMNRDFFFKSGPNWDRLLQHRVDFVVLDLSVPGLRPADLGSRGFVVVWEQAGASALLARRDYFEALRKVVAELPPTTIDPLDPAIPARWLF